MKADEDMTRSAQLSNLSFRVDFYISVYKTRFEEQKVQTTFANTKFCQAHQIGEEFESNLDIRYLDNKYCDCNVTKVLTSCTRLSTSRRRETGSTSRWTPADPASSTPPRPGYALQAHVLMWKIFFQVL